MPELIVYEDSNQISRLEKHIPRPVCIRKLGMQSHEESSDLRDPHNSIDTHEWRTIDVKITEHKVEVEIMDGILWKSHTAYPKHV